MSQQSFVRARTDDQRAARRAAILATAGEYLDEVRVADLGLNELARRVGLAKSNLLRYFESREAVLLELLDRAHAEWLDALEQRLDGDQDPEVLALAIAETAAARPRFCELVSASTAILEHNVSAEVAATHKRASLHLARRLARLVGPDDGPRAMAVTGVVLVTIAGLWSMCRPSEGMLQAYRENPELAVFRIDFTTGVRELVATFLAGLSVREPRL
ncbi:TetR family transcriptional regulator [Kineococcus sp. NBC_00420]|uniref:TetR/AcrR family transcriptional regulator n=1 Tax=Kineococcus sp. NBC_00420 TaxID=2903564 RepID=UPI002E1D16D9